VISLILQKILRPPARRNTLKLTRRALLYVRTTIGLLASGRLTGRCGRTCVAKGAVAQILSHAAMTTRCILLCNEALSRPDKSSSLTAFTHPDNNYDPIPALSHQSLYGYCNEGISRCRSPRAKLGRRTNIADRRWPALNGALYDAIGRRLAVANFSRQSNRSGEHRDKESSDDGEAHCAAEARWAGR
jgi:hypothetical protein